MIHGAVVFYPSPIGRLRLVADDAGRLCGLSLNSGHDGEALRPIQDNAIARETLGQAVHYLDAYFAGCALGPAPPIRLGGTAFQRRVWRALMTVDFGQTISYAELARRIGSPSAARAVGLANAANPLLLVVPCHRVIASNGGLAGFAAGVRAKRWLLDHERRFAGLFSPVNAAPGPASIT
ncbi:MAG: methylated-DNA--[protein]-cysteine S-methyltransferase [Planctomycetota bacterium]